MSRALLLTGRIGLGHTMPELSLRGLLDAAGWSVRTLDSMALLGAAQRAGHGVLAALMAVPGAYDGLHFAHLRTGSALARAMDGAATARMARALAGELAAAPADVIISVFATGAGAAAQVAGQAARSAPAGLTAPLPGLAPLSAGLAQAGLAGTAAASAAPRPKTVVYCPDVAVHRLWVHPGTDLFLVTSAAAAASVRRFRPEARIAVVPPPVRSAFYAAPSRQAARAQLAIPAASRCVLLIDSGWRLAPLAGAAARLADAGVHVLAVAGRSQRLERELRAAAASRPRLTPFGFTSEVPALMAAADLVVALPGATTCSEARVVGRPLLLLDVMPGHGRDNLLHQLELGQAGTCGPSARDICASALAMLDAAPGPGPGQPGPPRWEPAYCAALAQVGLDVSFTTPASSRSEEAQCAPSS